VAGGEQQRIRKIGGCRRLRAPGLLRFPLPIGNPLKRLGCPSPIRSEVLNDRGAGAHPHDHQLIFGPQMLKGRHQRGL
jgi:hypothetical protein